MLLIKKKLKIILQLIIKIILITQDSVSESDSDDDDDDDDDDEYIPENVPHVNNFNNYQPKEQSLEDILDEKKKILFELERLRRRGIPISKQYSLASNIDEMKTEFENIKKQREVENSVMFSRKNVNGFCNCY